MKLQMLKGTDRYIFDITPTVVMTTDVVYKDDTNKRLEELNKWEVAGYFVPGTESLSAQVDEFESFINVDGLDAVQLVNDQGTVITQLTSDDKVHVTEISYPDGSGPQFATRRNFQFTLSGRTALSVYATNGIYQYTIEYSTDQSGKITRVISGTVKDFKDNAAETKYLALVSAKAWIPWAGANLISKTHTINDENTVCTFSINQRQYWVAFPANITNAEITRSTSTDSQGTIKYKVSGWLEGPVVDCDTVITAEKAAGILVSQEISRSEYTNRTNFNLEMLAPVGVNNDIYFAQETLTIQSALDGIVFKPVLGGAVPVKQTVGKTTAKATQSGILKRLSTWPSPPALKWDAENLVSKTVSRLPLESKLGVTGYGLQYNYQYEFETTPSF